MPLHPFITESILNDLDEITLRSESDLKQLIDQNIVITGASGFVGKWLTLSWITAHKKWSGSGKLLLTSRDTSVVKEMADSIVRNDAVASLQSEIRTLAIPAQYANGLIIHAATPASASLNTSDPMTMFNTITEGHSQILSEARRLNSKVLFLSSGAVYGKQPLSMSHISEEWEGDHSESGDYSAYHEGKRTAETMSNIAKDRWGTSIVTARLFAFIAPYLPFGAHFAAGNFIRDALNSSLIEINSGGGSIRSYQYSTDLCSSLWTLGSRGVPGEKYNVGSDVAISIKELAQAVIKNVNPLAKMIIRGVDTSGNVTRYVPSTTKINNLGASNFVGLDEALKRTAQWSLQAAKGRSNS